MYHVILFFYSQSFFRTRMAASVETGSWSSAFHRLKQHFVPLSVRCREKRKEIANAADELVKLSLDASNR